MLLSSRLVGSGPSFVIDLADLDLWCDGALQSVGASLRRVQVREVRPVALMADLTRL